MSDPTQATQRPKWLTRDQAASALGVGAGTFRRLLRENETLRAAVVPVGTKTVRFRASAVDAFAEQFQAGSALPQRAEPTALREARESRGGAA